MALGNTAGLGRMANDLIGSFERSGAADLEQRVLNEAGPRRLSDVLSALDTAGDRSNRAFNAAASSFERDVRGLGRQLTARDEQVANRRFGLSRALANIDERNRTVQALRQRTDIARTAAADIRGALDSQAAGALSAAATAESAREQEYQQQLAEYKQKKAAGLGAIAGIAASFIPVAGPFVSGTVGSAVAGAAA